MLSEYLLSTYYVLTPLNAQGTLLDKAKKGLCPNKQTNKIYMRKKERRKREREEGNGGREDDIEKSDGSMGNI